jgi:hypothetical protein
MSPEKALYEFIKLNVEAANSGDVLYGVEVCPTVYHSFNKTAIRIGNCNSRFSRHYDQIVKEFDSKILIEILDKVGLDENADYSITCENVRSITLKIIEILLDDPTLGQGNCDMKIEDGIRQPVKLNGSPHYVALIPVVINPL